MRVQLLNSSTQSWLGVTFCHSRNPTTRHRSTSFTFHTIFTATFQVRYETRSLPQAADNGTDISTRNLQSLNSQSLKSTLLPFLECPPETTRKREIDLEREEERETKILEHMHMCALGKKPQYFQLKYD